MGCRCSSVDSSAPTILPPRVRVPSTPSTLFIVKICTMLSLCWERTKINKKEAGFGPFFLKKSYDRRAFITLATACNHTQTQRTDIQTRIRSLPCLFNSPFNVMLSLFLYSITHTLLLDALSSLSLSLSSQETCQKIFRACWKVLLLLMLLLHLMNKLHRSRRRIKSFFQRVFLYKSRF